jgi:hypothetical protein
MELQSINLNKGGKGFNDLEAIVVFAVFESLHRVDGDRFVFVARECLFHIFKSEFH